MQIPVYPFQISEGLTEEQDNQNKTHGGKGEQWRAKSLGTPSFMRVPGDAFPKKHPCLQRSPNIPGNVTLQHSGTGQTVQTSHTITYGLCSAVRSTKY